MVMCVARVMMVMDVDGKSKAPEKDTSQSNRFMVSIYAVTTTFV